MFVCQVKSTSSLEIEIPRLISNWWSSFIFLSSISSSPSVLPLLPSSSPIIHLTSFYPSPWLSRSFLHLPPSLQRHPTFSRYFFSPLTVTHSNSSNAFSSTSVPQRGQCPVACRAGVNFPLSIRLSIYTYYMISVPPPLSGWDGHNKARGASEDLKEPQKGLEETWNS